LIKFNKVFKRYPGEMDVLQDINLEIDAGDLIFVTGSSGAGKSTLIKLISAVERPSSGTIVFENQNINFLNKNEMPYL
jgi:cell division transport system ATP-binding protein